MWNKIPCFFATAPIWAIGSIVPISLLAVVESPDPRVFDQAIFILRNDVLGEDGVSSRQLVDQAVRIAKSYTRTQGLPPPKRHRLSPIIAAILGGGLMGLVWLAAALL